MLKKEQIRRLTSVLCEREVGSRILRRGQASRREGCSYASRSSCAEHMPAPPPARAQLCGSQIGCHVTGLIQHVLARFHGHLLDKFADTELLLAHHFDTDDVPRSVEVEHDEPFL